MNWFPEDEFREVETEAIAHSSTIRKIRQSIEKAVEILNDNTNCDGGCDEGVRMEAVSILDAALEKYRA